MIRTIIPIVKLDIIKNVAGDLSFAWINPCTSIPPSDPCCVTRPWTNDRLGP